MCSKLCIVLVVVVLGFVFTLANPLPKDDEKVAVSIKQASSMVPLSTSNLDKTDMTETASSNKINKEKLGKKPDVKEVEEDEKEEDVVGEDHNDGIDVYQAIKEMAKLKK